MRDVGVREGLQRLVDRFGVDAVTGLGVVLGLDGQGAADGGHVHLSADGDVRVTPRNVVLAGRVPPDDAVCGRQHVITLAARVEEPHATAAVVLPAQHADVVGLLAGLEDGEQLALDIAELKESCLAVVAEERGQLRHERGVVEEAGDGIVGQPGQVAVVEGEDVADVGCADARRGAQTEQQNVPHGDDVAREPRLVGAHGLARGERQVGGAERGDAAVVERRGAVGQLLCLKCESIAQDFVRARVQAGPRFRSGGHAWSPFPALLLRVQALGHARTRGPRYRGPGAIRWADQFLRDPFSSASGRSAMPS